MYLIASMCWVVRQCSSGTEMPITNHEVPKKKAKSNFFTLVLEQQKWIEDTIPPTLRNKVSDIS